MTEQTGDERRRWRCRVPGHVLFALLFAAFIAFMVGGIILGTKIDSKAARKLASQLQPPVYSISVTGLAGLDADDVAAGDRQPTLSPVFNLTLRVSNAHDKYQACVPLLSTASVFYGDAFLGKGSVAPFCADANGEREEQVRAWGQDVAVPRFLRDQLASEMRRGDAEVDVAVKMPAGCDTVACYDTVLVCRAKIRARGPSVLDGGQCRSEVDRDMKSLSF